MSPGDTATEISVTGRTADSLLNRQWGRLTVELLLIVVGILVALSIDGWVQDRADRSSEQRYLEMLHRDLELMSQQIADYASFERFNFDSGLEVLTALKRRDAGLQPEAIRRHLSNMGSRKTLRLVSATYVDLTSTGSLKLIRNRELRDHVLRYFAEVSRTERVVEKNNTVFVDALFFPFLMEKGISFVPDIGQQLEEAALQSSQSYLKEHLGEDYGVPMDQVLERPPDSPSWEDIRRMTQMRVFVSSIGLANAAQLARETAELELAIADELSAR